MASEKELGPYRVETVLDERTVRELDGWREGFAPPPSRSEAVRLLLEERLCGRKRQRRSERMPAPGLPGQDKLGALYTLARVSGMGPVKFREMHEAGVDPRTALRRPEVLPFGGRTGEKLRAAVAEMSEADMAWGRTRAAEQTERADVCGGSILIHGDAAYPQRVYASNNPVPVLYVRGDPFVWSDGRAVAVVGSRKTREPYARAARAFAMEASMMDMAVVSGFATGADSIGHSAAVEAGGRTVCVMPCGLDKVFPPENRGLWEQLLEYPGAAFVSEVGFGQRASSLLLRKRNKLIVAFAQAVLVAQSGADGGAMNAYRFAREQRKLVATFRPDGTAETSGNAQIASDARTGGQVFGVRDGRSKFETWLRGLSYWI